jgi:hypothetical protein
MGHLPLAVVPLSYPDSRCAREPENARILIHTVPQISSLRTLTASELITYLLMISSATILLLPSLLRNLYIYILASSRSPAYA